MFLVFFIGCLYLFLGFISLFIALVFFELGRPKDLIQSGLIILLGIFIIIYKTAFNFKFFLISSLNATLISFYFIENFSYRWNQLLEKEKFDIKSLSGLKKKLSVIYTIIRVDLKNILLNNKIDNLFKNNSIKKKWVRKRENNNPSDNGTSLKQNMKNIRTTDLPKKDIMNDEK